MKKSKALLYILSFLLAAVSVLVVSNNFSDPILDVKHSGSLIVGGILIFSLSLIAIKRDGIDIEDIVLIVGCSFFAVCVVESIIALVQYEYNGSRNIVLFGTFDNTAGLVSCISLGMPFGYEIWKRTDTQLIKVLLAIGEIICTMAILLSGSRVGMICVAFLLMSLGYRKNKLLFALLVALAVATIVFLTFRYKMTSTYGRGVILFVALKMAMEKSLFGWGNGGFVANYMNKQAEFFARNPNSEYAILADNVRHPLNEYLLVFVDYGVCGIVVVALCIFLVLKMLHGNNKASNVSALFVFYVILILSTFSYPFLYPFTWVCMGYVLCACVWQLIKSRSKVLFVYFLPVAIMLVGIGVKDAIWSIRLRKVQEMADKRMSKKVVQEYQDMFNDMKDNYVYLYSYAYALYEMGDYGMAKKMSETCEKYLSDYNLTLLRGDIAVGQNRYGEAILEYTKAHNMCPSRFVPLYETYYIYRMVGDENKRKDVAVEIMNKPMKVVNREVVDIVNEVRRLESGN